MVFTEHDVQFADWQLSLTSTSTKCNKNGQAADNGLQPELNGSCMTELDFQSTR